MKKKIKTNYANTHKHREGTANYIKVTVAAKTLSNKQKEAQWESHSLKYKQINKSSDSQRTTMTQQQTNTNIHANISVQIDSKILKKTQNMCMYLNKCRRGNKHKKGKLNIQTNINTYIYTTKYKRRMHIKHI